MADAVLLHVHRPQIQAIELPRLHCPNCERRTWFVAWFQEWYGWHNTCLNCGDQWQDGEMLERPFMPGWRKQNIEAARKMYRNKEQEVSN